MSYESQVHKAQIEILRALLFATNESWTQLVKATKLEPDHAKFHVGQLIQSGLVTKVGRKHVLTTHGKEYANRMDTAAMMMEKQPKISFAILVERLRVDGQVEYLRSQRLKQPFFGFWGGVSGKLRWGEGILEGAARELVEETGLTADLNLRVLYRKRDFNSHTGELFEDKLFLLIHGVNPKGKLIVDFEGGHNEWLTQAELKLKDKYFESALEFPEVIAAQPGISFVERTFQTDPADY